MPVGLVFDTCVVSESAKRPDLQSPIFRAWIQTIDPRAVIIPVAAIFEIQCGIQKIALTNPTKSAALSEWLESLLESNFCIQAMTTEIARLHARMVMTAALKNLWLPALKSGPQAPGQDLVIAATAIVLGAKIVTVNIRDFEIIDGYFSLPGLMNPISGSQPYAVT